MKIELEIDIGSGSWAPDKGIIEKINEAFNLKHMHENKDVLDSIKKVESEVLNDSDNPVSSKAVDAELKKKMTEEDVDKKLEKIHNHENKSVLDGLSADGESLMFNGKSIGGGAEIDMELLPAQIVASLLYKANVTTVFGTPEEISADDSYMNFFYSTSMDSYLVCVPSESGNLIYINGDTYEFTEKMNVNKGNLIIFWFNNELQLSNTAKGGEFLRQLLVDGIESVTSES